ncbi:hypothetical protein Ate01nite_01890 [Actinoplanes teichomyceticus]|nr:hypothetical protein Ate01nite_01890 [Actinoplanes teichomyceticus]
MAETAVVLPTPKPPAMTIFADVIAGGGSVSGTGRAAVSAEVIGCAAASGAVIGCAASGESQEAGTESLQER